MRDFIEKALNVSFLMRSRLSGAFLLFVSKYQLQNTMVSTRRTIIASPVRNVSESSAKKAHKKETSSPKLKSKTKSPKAAAKPTSPQRKGKIIIVSESMLLNTSPVLFELEHLQEATMICRPSKRNRSPYVADIDINGREAIAHVPNLDMGGKCVPGATIKVKPAVDKKGNPVGPNAVSPKYDTPKCEFITQLLHVDESNITGLYKPTWVGAHPSLGERIVQAWLARNMIPSIPAFTQIQREFVNPCGASMRSDFVGTDADGSRHIVEVKTVVDTDYCADYPADVKCLFTSDTKPYKRTAIFPWGNSNQKGPDGEKVVSARAINHIRELTSIAQGKKTENGERFTATVVFVVIRDDAVAFEPNYRACPSFCRYLKAAHDAGVNLVAKKVRWEGGKCVSDEEVPIVWPKEVL